MPIQRHPLLVGLFGIALCTLSFGVHAAPVAPTPPAPPMIAVEQAIEAEAASVELPQSLGGTLSVRTCARCPTERYATDSQTAYLARSTSMSASEWQALARSNPRSPVTVLLDARTHVVTRVLVDLGAPTRRTP